MSECRFPSKPGVYTLVIELIEAASIRVGGLGVQSFPGGFYAYTGSALGEGSMNLRNRIQRHLNLTRGKRKHWHIDYLLDSDVSRLKAVIFVETSFNVECAVSRELARLEGAGIIVKGFGASDCRSECQSHLCFYSKASYKELVENITSIYRKLGSAKTFHVEDEGV